MAVTAVASVPAAIAVAQSTQTDSVTGGGEFVLDLRQQAGQPGQGPGDTVAFTAQQAPDPGSRFGDLAATGEVELVDRHGSAMGRDNSILHGTVDCLAIAGRKAVIGYHVRFGGVEDFRVHQLTVIDNEEPTDDLIINDFDAVLPCVVEAPPDGTDHQLARGEVMIHNVE